MADRRLLTDRWRRDGAEAAVDPHAAGNMFSFNYRSRLDIHLADGTAYDNEDLRDDAHGLSSADGWPGEYSYVDIARSPRPASPRTPRTARCASRPRRASVRRGSRRDNGPGLGRGCA